MKTLRIEYFPLTLDVEGGSNCNNYRGTLESNGEQYWSNNVVSICEWFRDSGVEHVILPEDTSIKDINVCRKILASKLEEANTAKRLLAQV